VRITITGPGTAVAGGQTVAATPFLLGDDSIGAGAIIGTTFPNGAGGQFKGGLNTRLTRATQVDDLINAAYGQELPRGNARVTFSFTVQRTMTTSDVAMMFLRDHPALVPASGTLAVVIANTTAYLKNAVVKSVTSSDQTDISFNFTYEVSGSYIAPISGAAGTGTGGPFTAS